MKKIVYLLACLLGAVAVLAACSDDETAATSGSEPQEYTLTVAGGPVADFPAEGIASGSEESPVLTITTTAPSWRIARAEGNDWLNATVTTGMRGSTDTRLWAAANEDGTSRTASLVVTAAGCEDVTITVTQQGRITVPLVDPDDLPDAVEADPSGMESDAMTLYKKMFAGINIGNTLEACNNNDGSPDMTTWTGGETMWGNPRISQKLIDGYKAAGFNAVRIPVSWVSGHIVDHADWKIDPEWLARVKEVVDYCYTAGDMYAIINIHWDGGWLETNPTSAKRDEVNAMQLRLWTQIAKYFRDYDEHLLFAGTNEVHDGYGEPTAENIEVQQSYNQTFVDAVRATGGRNAWRVLVTQTYNTNVWQGNKYHKMSDDTVAGRQMLEVHCYSPWTFCGDNASGTTWGTAAEIASLETEFRQLDKFFDAGYPIILGEYGALYNAAHGDDPAYMQSRCDWIYHATKFAKENGYVPFVWDTGADVLNRATGAVLSEQTGYVESLMRGAADGRYPD